MSAPSEPSATGESESVRHHLKGAFITGLALTIPVAITGFLIVFVVRFAAGFFDPIVDVITTNFDANSRLVIGGLYLLTLFIVLALVALIGLAAETTSGRRIELVVSNAIERIPGIGSVYGSFNEMSELLLDSDSQSFQEVVLVEYPTQGSYSVAFLTADTPENIKESTGHDSMRTVFMPMAPNPVMGGFVMHVAEERIYEVDMSVEDGIQSIVTSGVAIGEEEKEGILQPSSTASSADEGHAGVD